MVLFILIHKILDYWKLEVQKDYFYYFGVISDCPEIDIVSVSGDGSLSTRYR